jgi:uncharacterized OB-fold protein
MRPIPKPLTLPDTAAYWQAAGEGRLLLKRCRACGEHHHYPRDVCPFCHSLDTEWVQAAGTGTVYSHSTMGDGNGVEDATYTIAFVTLDEGPTVWTNLVPSEGEAANTPLRGRWHIGQRVCVVFRPSGPPQDPGPVVPFFTAMA